MKDKMQVFPLQKGVFLIASPEIDEGIFSRSVVLLCEHNSLGSLGLIINKPLNIELPEELKTLNHLTSPQVRAGGPYQTDQLMIIHSLGKEEDPILKICEGVYIGGDLEFLEKGLLQVEAPSLLLCLGYGSWSTGILEQEYMGGLWFLYPATKKHVFETPPTTLWQTLLQEMGGKYKILSLIPEDLEVN